VRSEVWEDGGEELRFKGLGLRVARDRGLGLKGSGVQGFRGSG
jgi:hypothetical protein